MKRIATALLLAMAAACLAQTNPWMSVAKIFGREGELNKDGSYKITIYRSDLQIQNSFGMLMPPEIGLYSYAAFLGSPDKATVVGDTCMIRDEIDPVVDALRAGGIEVVALHNHMAGESPAIYFLHFQGRGTAEKLAGTVKRAFDELTKDHPLREGLTRTGQMPVVDWKAVSSILRRPVAQVGSSRVMKATLPRDDMNVTLDGVRLTPGVGLACWAAFGGCTCGRTMVMGDTVVNRTELQRALDAFRKNGISVTAIHNHTVGQDSVLMFMHFEAEGDALKLANGVRAAWDCLGTK
jgi:hypothetical protein